MVCKVAGMPWPYAVRLRSDRLVLDPLSIEHADVMVNVLAPRELYRFTGGEAAERRDLRARYTRQVRGQSEDGAAGWLNWITMLVPAAHQSDSCRRLCTGRAAEA